MSKTANMPVEGDVEHRQEHQFAPENTEPSSRICIKNLPKNADEKRLREHFSAKGEVTDAKIMRTRDGSKSRCFGFVGFASADQAQEAVKYFNNSYMDACRLIVEFAYKYGTAEQRGAWSKYTEGTSANKRIKLATGANSTPIDATATAANNKNRKTTKEPPPEQQDPKLKEFLTLMASRSQKPIWANDDAAGTGANAVLVQQRPKAGGEAAALDGDNDSDDDLYEDLPGDASKKRKSKQQVLADDEEEAEKDVAVVDAGVSDMDYLKSRMRRNFDEDMAQGEDSDDDEDIEDNSDEEEEDGALAKKQASAKNSSKTTAAAAGGEEKEPVDAFAAAIQQAEDEDNNDDEQQQQDDDDDDIDDIFDGKARRDPSIKPPTTKNNNDADDADQQANTTTNNNTINTGSKQVAANTIDPQTVISETGRLFVRNLPYTAVEDDLRVLFETYGELTEVHVVQDRLTRRSKGFAMVQYEDPTSALAAFTALDGAIFMGRLLHILPGKAAPPPPEVNPENNATDGADADGANATNGKAAAGGTSSFKRQQEEKLRSTAGDNKSAWNSLFMRSDTVAEAVAAHFGVSKAELLDRTANDMAVRLALGETQIIAKTKKELGDAGVNIESLETAATAAGKGTSSTSSRKIKRSDKALLIKNLPYSTDADELEGLFSGLGTVARFVLPTTRTLALVEYLEAADAKKAFKSLAYKRYQHVPLYLEWAPVDVFDGSKVPSTTTGTAADTSADKKKSKDLAGTTTAAGDENNDTTTTATDINTGTSSGKAIGESLTAATTTENDNIDSTTIFVKNLAFKTVDASLTKHFEKAVGGKNKAALRSVKVSKRKGPDGKMLSSGFGFVECSDENSARALIQALQGSTLDGHKLVLQLAQSNKSAAAEKKKKAAAAAGGKENTKIIVRNVAFEATRKDIMGLFTPFGQVQSCRLPRKFDGTPRGFAFVEFATPKEASNAVEAVQGTHLYGRRLVIEWAEEDGGLDELREKTAKKYFNEDDE